MEFILSENKIYPTFNGVIIKIDNRVKNYSVIWDIENNYYKCNKLTSDYLSKRFGIVLKK